jgi:hypothetical protein
MQQLYRGEYISWVGMRQRCLYHGHIEFHRYGGRGITICEQWRSSFESFFRDMGPRPLGCSLERIDNAGNYEPGNCRWATQSEQMNNTASNILVEYAGQSMTLMQLATQLGIDYHRLYRFHRRSGYSLADAIAKSQIPFKPRRYNR